jgi:hypothetical protein
MSFFRKIIILSLLSGISSVAISQGKRDKASSDILMLKDGALLIKLKTSDNLINGLIRAGKTEQAEQAKKDQAALNSDIIKAFKEHYNFSKVYFFYSRNSAEVKRGELKGILMNYDLHTDSTFSGKNFLTAEFSESASNGLEGFIVGDNQFNALRSPFPFMIRLNKNGIIRRTNTEIVKELNKEFYNFYDKVK